MPTVEVVYYREGCQVPMVEWLAKLPPDARDACNAHLRLLQREGFELRAKRRGINYRMLYFFHGRQAIVVSHGFAKQRSRVPESEIRWAIERMARFEADPMAHRSVAEI